MNWRIPVDRATSRAWIEVAHGARWTNRMLNGVSDPSAGSNFAQIDELYPNEHASDWHRSYLDAALQHLVLWADLVAPLWFHPEQKVVQAFRPAYTLGRAALEAASQAVWMTAGETAAECARRHLSLIRWDYEEHRKSVSGEEAKRSMREMDTRLLDRVRGQFGERDLAPPSHLSVARRAARAIGVEPDDVERVWRAASGAAHGKLWPSVSLQHIVAQYEYEPGRFRTARIPDPKGMTEVLQLAEQMTTFGVVRHVEYCGAAVQASMDEARLWLMSVVPLRDDLDPDVVAYLTRRRGG